MIWRIRLFGGLRAERNGQTVTTFRTRKAELLLAHLSLYGERPHSRESLVKLLWPEADRTAALHSLSTTLHYLRQVLEPAPLDRGSVILADRHTIHLDRHAVAIDAAEFGATVKAADEAYSAVDRQHLWASALQLYDGDLLPGYDETWVRRERQRLCETYVDTLLALTRRLEEEGDLSGALQHARRGASRCPLCERAHQEVIRLCLVSDQLHAARLQYQELRECLARELGSTPSQQTLALIEDAEDNQQRPRVEPAPAVSLQGANCLEQGDLTGAMTFFAKVLLLEEPDCDRAMVHQMRLEAIRRRCPQLVRVWFGEHPAEWAQFSPGGRHIAAAFADGAVRVFELARQGGVRAEMRHEGRVRRVVFSPDGSLLLTASDDGTARLWHAETGEAATPALGHEAAVTQAAFSPDGQRVVTACEDGVAQVWSALSGERVAEALRHSEAVWHAQFDPSGQKVVTASMDGTAQVWDAATGAKLGLALRHEGGIRQATFDPDGRRLATGGGDGTARIWDAASGEPLTPALVHGSRAVMRTAFSPGGRLLATACYDGTVRLWESANGVPLWLNQTVGRDLFWVEFSADGEWLLVADAYGACGVIDVETGGLAQPPVYGLSRLRSVGLSSDRRRLLTAGSSGQVRVWELARNPEPRCRMPHRAGVHISRAVFSADGSRIATADVDGRARVWDAETGTPVTPWLGHDGPVWDVAFSPDGRFLVTGGRDTTVRIWHVETGDLADRRSGHEGSIRSVECSPDGAHVLTASRDGTARVWDLAGRPAQRVLEHRATVRWASYSSDGQRVATACADGRGRIWDVTGDNLRCRELPHGRDVVHTAFSPDGRLLATAGVEGEAQLWQVADGTPVGARMAHRDAIQRVVFYATSRLLTISADSTVRVWEVPSGAPVTPYLRHTDWVLWGAFSDDGLVVVTGGNDGDVRFWETATGIPVGPPIRHRALVSHLSFSPCGRFLSTTCSDGVARIWELPESRRSPEEWRLTAQVLASRWPGATLCLEPLDATSYRQAWQQLATAERNGPRGRRKPARRVALAAVGNDSRVEHS